MTKHLNWYKRSPRDWQAGTLGMSLELRGFYSALLDAMWEKQGQLPKDDKWLAMACHCSTRLVRSSMVKLIDAGKIIETETGYYNRRMMADILGLDDVAPCGQFAPVSKPVQPPVALGSISTQPRFDLGSISNQPRTEIEPSAKNGKNPEVSTRARALDNNINTNTITEAEAEQNARAREAGRRFRPAVDLKTLSDQVTAACEPALDRQAMALGLASMSIPLMWIEHGADLDRDVIPTLTAAGVRYRGKGIRTWDYFTNMIAEAKAKRLAGLPTVDVGHLAKSQPNARDVLAQMKFS